MRSKILAMICFLFLFTIQPVVVPTLHAMGDPQVNPSGDLAPGPNDENEPWLFERPSEDGDEDPAEPRPSATVPVDDGSAGALVVPANMPPLIIGQHEGETVLIAMDQAGNVISMIKYVPGLGEPVGTGQELQTIFDLGFGINGQLGWNIVTGAISFSFLP